MLRSFAAAAFVVVASSSVLPSRAQGQTIFAPVQYQYGEGRDRYYYGGNDPAVFRLAEQRRGIDQLGDHPFSSQRYTQACVHRRLIGQLDRVYSDAAPYTNARVFGYLPVDAMNDANANVPRYFRKGDLRVAGVAERDGSVVVAAQAQPVEGAWRRAVRATTQPVKPRAILILPRGDKAKGSDKLVATAAG